jgi:uncharacterized protein (DUF1778 family)
MTPSQDRIQQRKGRSSKSYRFDARLNESQKLLIQRAADLEGRSLTDFVLQSAESAAARAIQERTMMVLSARESEAFVEKLLTPSALGRALRDAAKRYKKRLGAE